MTRTTATTPSRTAPGRVERHGNQGFAGQASDPYQQPGKYAEPTRCGECGAVFRGGRWQWGDAPETAHEKSCPACRRTRDKLPAGVLTLAGPFVAAHREELLAIARNEAAHQRPEHPLSRIMEVVERGDAIEITTTDIHLPQRIGNALKHAYHGELAVHYGPDEYSVRLDWRR